jgi:hypothetical protein
MAKEQFSFRFEKDLIKAIDKLAEKDHRSRTNYVEIVLTQHIETKTKKGMD